MANTGKLLPFSTRMEIRQRRQIPEPIRKIAQSLGLSKTTVQKYSGNNRGTKLLNDKGESA